MKTAISVPERVFRAAERHARRAGKSRSQLYAEALTEYLTRHAPDEVTDAMNRVVDKVPAAPDAFVATAVRRVLERTEW
jgi:metal-responsive CopG/Arc/MetJ family transcriptional regulator